MDAKSSIEFKLGLLKELGLAVTPESTILDFGCGEGKVVQGFLDQGFDCYGCDMRHHDLDSFKELLTSERVRMIEEPYRLPFEDNTFDVVTSDQVFEHVQNYKVALSELARVTKPTGICLHVFPTRYCLIEPHVFVPFATIYRPRWWMKLWAILGVRTRFQKGQNVKQRVDHNIEYLENSTNYLPKSKIVEISSEHFEVTNFEMKKALNHHPKLKKFPLSLVRYLPGAASLIATFSTHVMLQQKPMKG